MKSIKKRRNMYAAIFVGAMSLTILFAVLQETEAAIASTVCIAVVLLFLYKQIRLLYVASVIVDSRILTVPSSIVTTEKRPNPKRAEETIVSTFGLLLGNKVYRWGCEGVYGVRLQKVRIDKEHICLSFGDDGEMQRVELLHGLTDKQSVTEITQKLWHETGVQAEVNDW